MKKTTYLMFALIMTVILTDFVPAQELIIYPAKGQSKDQLEKDKYKCYAWAKKQTGFDPMQIPKATAPPPEETAKTSTGKSAVCGAAIGGAIGSTQGKFGKGVAIGAVAGGLIGGLRHRGQVKEQQQADQQWAQKQANNYTQQRNQYNRAYGACLEGKGYTVK